MRACDGGVTAAFPANHEISSHEFQLLQELVRSHTGISLSDHKRSLVASRLGKRLRALNLGSFRSYYDFLVGERGAEELEQFVNAMTTNKTDFYREPVHFEFLEREIIPVLKMRAARTGERRIRIWSAGCSTGEEPYTIALTLCEALGRLLTWDVRILASDIDTEVLAKADRGVYPRERVVDIPPALLHRYFLQGTGDNEGLVKVAPSLRTLVTFRRINFLDNPWPIRGLFDCIFCRNVIIYFDKATQTRLMQRFADHLKDDGYLFLGHSESLHGMSERFAFVRNTIYRRTGSQESMCRAGGAST
jgi:chemotaxis protein methyltransferase CheR